MRLRAAAALLLAAISPLIAQQTGAVIRINVNLVQIDAVVTDANGNPVTDLKPSEFQIRQDRKPQTITNFSFVQLHAGHPIAAVQGRNVIPPAVLRAADVRRTIVFVVDDLSLPFASLVNVRESLKKFVDQQMMQGDLIAILRTSGGMGAFQRFSSDPRQIRAAIDRLTYSLIRGPRTAFTPLSSDPASVALEMRDAFAVGTLGSLAYVASGLREMPGRKSLILFSQHMPLFNTPAPDGKDVAGAVPGIAAAFQRLADAANRASMVVHTIDPRGITFNGLNAQTAAPAPRPAEPRGGEDIDPDMAEVAEQDGLVLLAEQTGGVFQASNNDLGAMMRKALADTAGYYLIGYHPDTGTFNMSSSDVFHRLSVRVTRPGVYVRSRRGFFGNPDPQDGKPRTFVPQTAQAQLLHALDAPFSVGNIHLRLQALFTDSPELGPLLNTRLHIDARDLQFRTDPDGSQKAVFDLLAATFGEKNEVISRVNRTYTLRCKGADCEAGRRDGFVYALNFPVAKPGAYQMRVALRDAVSQDTGSASQFIEVPDLSKGRLALSSLMVRQSGPAHTIEYGYQILNARLDPHHMPRLEAQALVFHNGEQVYAGPPHPLDVGANFDPKHLAAGGALQLGTDIPPGDYVVEVVVTDKLAKEKNRSASQWMDVEINR